MASRHERPLDDTCLGPRRGCGAGTGASAGILCRPDHRPSGLDRRALGLAGALFGLAALLTGARLLIGVAALSTTSLWSVLPLVALVVTLATSAALWLVSGRRGISAASPAGRVALRVAAVGQVAVAVLTLVPAVLASYPGTIVALLLTLVPVLAALVGAVLAARSRSVRGVAGWALVPWAVVALARDVVFSTPVGFALGASSIAVVSYGGQVLTVATLLSATVAWLVAGLGSPVART